MLSVRRGRRPIVLVAAGITAGVALAAAQPGGAGAEGDAAVTIKSFQYQPAELTVPSGTTVTWNNIDKILHTATSGTPGAPDGRFHGEMPDAGTSFSTTLTAPGTYDYFCSRHEQMIGRIVVQ